MVEINAIIKYDLDMKKQNIIVISVVLLVFAVLSLVVALIVSQSITERLGTGCAKCVSSNVDVKSPSGKYSLKVIPSDSTTTYDIQITPTDLVKTSPAENIGITEVGFFSLRSRTNIMWDNSQDTVWVYSGDRGIYYYQIVDGQWKRNGTADLTNVKTCPPYDFYQLNQWTVKAFKNCDY